MSNTSENKAKESKKQRQERIQNSNNGATMRTRVVPNKKKYNRAKEKAKKECQM